MRMNQGYGPEDDDLERPWRYGPEPIAQADLVKDDPDEDDDDGFPLGRTSEEKCADEAGLIRTGLLDWGILSDGERNRLAVYFDPLAYAFRITPNEDFDEFFTIHAWVYFGLVQPTTDLGWWMKQVSYPAQDPVDVGFHAFIHRDIHLIGKLILNAEWSYCKYPSWSLTNDFCLWFVEMDEYREKLEENHFYSPDTQAAASVLNGLVEF